MPKKFQSRVRSGLSLAKGSKQQNRPLALRRFFPSRHVEKADKRGWRGSGQLMSGNGFGSIFLCVHGGPPPSTDAPLTTGSACAIVSPRGLAHTYGTTDRSYPFPFRLVPTHPSFPVHLSACPSPSSYSSMVRSSLLQSKSHYGNFARLVVLQTMGDDCHSELNS